MERVAISRNEVAESLYNYFKEAKNGSYCELLILKNDFFSHFPLFSHLKRPILYRVRKLSQCKHYQGRNSLYTTYSGEKGPYNVLHTAETYYTLF